MAQIPTLTFSNGYKMPAFGLGTYQVRFHLYIIYISNLYIKKIFISNNFNKIKRLYQSLVNFF